MEDPALMECGMQLYLDGWWVGRSRKICVALGRRQVPDSQVSDRGCERTLKAVGA